MSGRVTGRDTAARQNLKRLAEQFREVGVTAEFHPDPYRSTPGLLVTEDGASTLILAGYATYFRQSHDRVVSEVGPLCDLLGAVRAIREHLSDLRRQAGAVNESVAEEARR